MSSAAPLVPEFLSGVPADLHDWLREQTKRINALAYRAVCDYVRIGTVLEEVRVRLGAERQFRAYVEAECPFGVSHAYKLARIAVAFGPYVQPEGREAISPKALVLLSAAPREAVAFAVEQAQDGRRITSAEAREIVAAYRPQPDPTRAQVKAHEVNMEPVREAERDERQGVRDADRAAAAERDRAARALAQLERLARAGGVVTVTAVDDDEADEDDDPPPYHVAALLPAGRRAATRRSLADAIAAVLDEEEPLKCRGCKLVKPAGEFGENKSKTGGKCSRCKACERERHRVRKLRNRVAG